MRMRPWIAALCSVAFLSCLKADDRPTPGHLMVTASPSDAVVNGITTVDGWQLSFSKVLISLGGVEENSDSCDEFSFARYRRILNMLAGSNQKVSEHYALGNCDLRFRMAHANDDSPLGAQVTPADQWEMLRPDVGGETAVAPAVLLVEGKGMRAGASVRFHFVLVRAYTYTHCKLMVDGQEQGFAEFQGGVTNTYDIRVDAERLFRDDNTETAQLRFDPFAGADADQNGEVTLDELDAVSIDELRKTGPYGMDEATAKEVVSLAHYMNAVLLSTVPRYRGTGECSTAGGGKDDEP